MTVVRLGYVAMSVHVPHCSPSQTMTVARFRAIRDREAAIRKLERIALSNVENCLRLLKYNKAHDIRFFRLSSRLIPLANHPELESWDYLAPIREALRSIALFLREYPMRLDFHPEHFVVLNSPDSNVFHASLNALKLHGELLRGMGIDLEHRCVLHLGGGYGDKEKALEQLIHNWAYIPAPLQRMIMFENDDTVFTLRDALYACEKLGVPLVFDLHHHLANRDEEDWRPDWERIVATWRHSPLPMKMHLSSPKSDRQFRAHHDFVDAEMFIRFLREVNGTVRQLDCMIEAKQKDEALFQLVRDLKRYDEIELIDGASFYVK
ncbi:UV damage endonuclease UvsE [Geobacillus sp. 46C-IIa]|uniref:UV DNA damage repair endonuclease UvsE n=1 Tax=Geobacillus sp. 46C-IIa TaxID=1963025 RepID=UPI0009C114FF|nr:UV DNA damage repair endonuclease UvsE [Geobacillus sp. 46C-IIa]OQP07162.1 UV damage endonuclease UvsE [Geobacillus sp. 46C-IIa]QNU29485.1 UV DNA damage repair endonuclease UvsE [Geobacillus sp. 46C-IIa]